MKIFKHTLQRHLIPIKKRIFKRIGKYLSRTNFGEMIGPNLGMGKKGRHTNLLQQGEHFGTNPNDRGD